MIEVDGKSVRRAPRALVIEPKDEADPGAGFAPIGAWKPLLLDELRRSEVRGRLAGGLIGVGFIHLVFFLGCQAIYDPAVIRDLRHPALWLGEFVTVLGYLRWSLGPGWTRSASAVNLAAKFWTTFLILSFNLVTLNSITGFELAWFKPVWATLSTFLFASMAWLFTPWFFVPAVQMWATGMLMVHFPDWCFLIYGVSWFLALTGVALWIRPRDRALTR